MSSKANFKKITENYNYIHNLYFWKHYAEHTIHGKQFMPLLVSCFGVLWRLMCGEQGVRIPSTCAICFIVYKSLPILCVSVAHAVFYIAVWGDWHSSYPSDL